MATDPLGWVLDEFRQAAEDTSRDSGQTPPANDRDDDMVRVEAREEPGAGRKPRPRREFGGEISPLPAYIQVERRYEARTQAET